MISWRAWRVAVVLLLALACTPALAGAQYFGRNKVQYRTFAFRILQTEHFDLYYYPEEREAAHRFLYVAWRHALLPEGQLKKFVRAVASLPSAPQGKERPRSHWDNLGRLSGLRDRMIFRMIAARDWRSFDPALTPLLAEARLVVAP